MSFCLFIIFNHVPNSCVLVYGCFRYIFVLCLVQAVYKVTGFVFVSGALSFVYVCHLYSSSPMYTDISYNYLTIQRDAPWLCARLNSCNAAFSWFAQLVTWAVMNRFPRLVAAEKKHRALVLIPFSINKGLVNNWDLNNAPWWFQYWKRIGLFKAIFVIFMYL